MTNVPSLLFLCLIIMIQVSLTTSFQTSALFLTKNLRRPSQFESLIDSKELSASVSIDHVGGADMSNLKWFTMKVDKDHLKTVDPVTKNSNCDQYFSKWCALTCNFKFNKSQQYCAFEESSNESTCCCSFEPGVNQCTKLVKQP